MDKNIVPLELTGTNKTKVRIPLISDKQIYNDSINGVLEIERRETSGVWIFGGMIAIHCFEMEHAHI